MDKQRSHEIIEDIRRVAVELDETPSRRQYLSLGRFSERQVNNHFGGWNVAVKASGLTPICEQEKSASPELKKLDKQVAKYEKKVSLGEKFSSEILPYVGKYERKLGNTFVLMIRSDDHGEWVDPFCDSVFWDVARRIQPDAIAFNGDTADFWEVSAHSKDPSRQMDMQREIDFVVEHMFKKARETCPEAQLDWILGNHEWRLFKYLSDVAPALSSLRNLQFQNLFELDKYRVNLVANESFVTSRTEKELENYKVYEDVFCVVHGFSCAKHPAQNELGVYGKSGTSGHVHRHNYFFNRNLYGHHMWLSTGAMCQLRSGKEYIKNLINWENGFLIVHIEDGRVFPEYVDLTDGFACVGGVYYRRSDGR